jgi:O-antigen/teichoic acid export membrane protein
MTIQAAQKKTKKSFDPAVATVKGTFWTYLSHFSGKMMSFVTTIILARLLVKEDFGVASFAIIVIGLLEVFHDLGIGLALIYHDHDQKKANTGFWLGLGIGISLFTLTFMLAPFAADFFNDPRAIGVIRVLALTFPLAALSNVHDALLRKQLRFGRKVIPDFVRSLSKGLIAITLAILGFGAWSLIWGQVLGTAVAVIAFWIIHPFRPNFQFDTQSVNQLLSYGLGIVGVHALGVLLLNIDYLFVGRFLGAVALGVYTLSFRVPELLIKKFCGTIGRVIFPVYAKLRDDKQSLGTGFLTTIRYVTMVTVPIGVGLALIAQPFVLTVFSDKWREAIPVMQGVAIFTLIRSLLYNVGDVYKAQGRLALLTKLSSLQIALMVPALWWAVVIERSIVAAAWVQAGVALITGIIKLAIAARILETPLKKFGQAVEPAFLGTVVMTAAVLVMLQLVPSTLPAVQLIASVITGLLAYLATLWWLKRDLVLIAGQTLRMALIHR